MSDEVTGLSEEQVATVMASLPERFADRLMPSSLRSAQEDRDVGEWLLALMCVINGLARAHASATTREHGVLRRFLVTFSAPHLPEPTADVVARLYATLAGVPVTQSVPEFEIPALGRHVAERFAARIPEDDRWEIEEPAEDEDWEMVVDAAVALLGRHRIMTDEEDRELLATLLDAFDMPRTRLRRLARVGQPAPDGGDHDRTGALARALERRDGPRWVELLDTAELYVPVAEPGSPWPQSLPPPDDPDQVVAFTTPDGFDSIIGGVPDGHVVTTVAQLRLDRPAHARLVLDPALPTGVALPFAELDDLRAGRIGLVPVRDVQDAAVEDALAGIRRLTLDGLGVTGWPASPARRDWPPDLDTIAGLVLRNVVVLAAEASTEPAWRVVSDEETRIVPAFTSIQALDAVLPGRPPRQWLCLIDLARAWPDGHVLHLDPGTPDELILIDDMVHQLVELAETAADTAARRATADHQTADDLLHRWVRDQSSEPPPSRTPGYILSTPEEIAALDASRAPVDAAYPPAPEGPTGGSRSPEPPSLLGQIWAGVAPMLAFVGLTALFIIVLPDPANLYAPAAGAATTALLWWMFGDRDVPVGGLFLAGFFAILGTIGIFVVR